MINGFYFYLFIFISWWSKVALYIHFFILSLLESNFPGFTCIVSSQVIQVWYVTGKDEEKKAEHIVPSSTPQRCFFISSLRGCVLDLAPGLDYLLGLSSVVFGPDYMLSGELLVHLQFSGSHVLLDWR
jgi:hypothetical protein